MNCVFCGKDFNIHSYSFLNDGEISVCDDCVRIMQGIIPCSRCSNLIYFRQGFNINGYFKNNHVYCQHCARDLHIITIPTFSHRDNNLHDYCYKPSPVFYPATSRRNNLYLGVELEMGGARSSSAVNNFCNNHYGKIFYFKTDCSIRSYGCEVVTHPCTVEFHRSQDSGWSELLNDAISTGLNSGTDVNCGIHVHMNRNYFTEAQLKKIDLFVNYYRDIWEKIAGRSNCHYCSFGMKRHSNWGQSTGSRYASVNFQNSNTIELRIFNGNMNFDDVMSTLEICDALANFPNEVSFEDLYENKDHTKNVFRHMLFDNNKYNFASDFCINKHIF